MRNSHTRGQAATYYVLGWSLVEFGALGLRHIPMAVYICIVGCKQGGDWYIYWFGKIQLGVVYTYISIGAAVCVFSSKCSSEVGIAEPCSY